MERQKIKNHYFKQGQGLISGIPLKGWQRNIHFIDCDFHPNTWNRKYNNCIFEDCEIKGCLTMTTNCQYLGNYP